MKFSESLKKNRYFQDVYKNGKSYANRYFVMYVLENNLGRNRIGISVSKKVGNSVIRHHEVGKGIIQAAGRDVLLWMGYSHNSQGGSKAGILP